MKQVLNDFCKLLANCVLIICLLVAGFLLFINLYHYKEISYESDARLAENVKYINFKENLVKIEKKLNDVDLNKIQGEKNSIGANVKKEIEGCINDLKQSELFLLDRKQYIKSKDLYDINNQMYNELNNTCLFYMNYNIKQQISSKNMYNLDDKVLEDSCLDYSGKQLNEKDKNKSDFMSLYCRSKLDKASIVSSTNYLTERLLGNSSYRYITDVTRNSIFNEQLANLSLTIDNYNTLLLVLNDTTDWFINEFGGAS